MTKTRKMLNKTNRNCTAQERILFVILQCSWGILQTLIGVIVFCIMIRCPHKRYRGSIDTRWNLEKGLSLGLFLFTPNEETPDTNELRIHEYGHCIQSMLLGPFYLILVLISMIWAGFPYFVKLRKEKHIPYTACFVESWASKWGEQITGEQAI